MPKDEKGTGVQSKKVLKMIAFMSVVVCVGSTLKHTVAALLREWLPCDRDGRRDFLATHGIVPLPGGTMVWCSDASTHRKATEFVKKNQGKLWYGDNLSALRGGRDAHLEKTLDTQSATTHQQREVIRDACEGFGRSYTRWAYARQLATITSQVQGVHCISTWKATRKRDSKRDSCGCFLLAICALLAWVRSWYDSTQPKLASILMWGADAVRVITAAARVRIPSYEMMSNGPQMRHTRMQGFQTMTEHFLEMVDELLDGDDTQMNIAHGARVYADFIVGNSPADVNTGVLEGDSQDFVLYLKSTDRWRVDRDRFADSEAGKWLRTHADHHFHPAPEQAEADWFSNNPLKRFDMDCEFAGFDSAIPVFKKGRSVWEGGPEQTVEEVKLGVQFESSALQLRAFVFHAQRPGGASVLLLVQWLAAYIVFAKSRCFKQLAYIWSLHLENLLDVQFPFIIGIFEACMGNPSAMVFHLASGVMMGVYIETYGPVWGALINLGLHYLHNWTVMHKWTKLYRLIKFWYHFVCYLHCPTWMVLTATFAGQALDYVRRKVLKTENHLDGESLERALSGTMTRQDATSGSDFVVGSVFAAVDSVMLHYCTPSLFMSYTYFLFNGYGLLTSGAMTLFWCVTQTFGMMWGYQLLLVPRLLLVISSMKGKKRGYCFVLMLVCMSLPNRARYHALQCLKDSQVGRHNPVSYVLLVGALWFAFRESGAFSWALNGANGEYTGLDDVMKKKHVTKTGRKGSEGAAVRQLAEQVDKERAKDEVAKEMKEEKKPHFKRERPFKVPVTLGNMELPRRFVFSTKPDDELSVLPDHLFEAGNMFDKYVVPSNGDNVAILIWVLGSVRRFLNKLADLLEPYWEVGALVLGTVADGADLLYSHVTEKYSVPRMWDRMPAELADGWDTYIVDTVKMATAADGDEMSDVRPYTQVKTDCLQVPEPVRMRITKHMTRPYTDLAFINEFSDHHFGTHYVESKKLLLNLSEPFDAVTVVANFSSVSSDRSQLMQSMKQLSARIDLETAVNSSAEARCQMGLQRDLGRMWILYCNRNAENLFPSAVLPAA